MVKGMWNNCVQAAGESGLGLEARGSFGVRVR